MKVFILLLLLTVAAIASTATVNLQWDPNDPADNVTSYVVYEQTGPATWVMVAEVTGTTYAVVGATIGTHTYAVTAKSMVGESDRSNSVVANTAKPKAPKGARVFSITIVP